MYRLDEIFFSAASCETYFHPRERRVEGEKEMASDQFNLSSEAYLPERGPFCFHSSASREFREGYRDRVEWSMLANVHFINVVEKYMSEGEKRNGTAVVAFMRDWKGDEFNGCVLIEMIGLLIFFLLLSYKLNKIVHQQGVNINLYT